MNQGSRPFGRLLLAHRRARRRAAGSTTFGEQLSGWARSVLRPHEPLGRDSRTDGHMEELPHRPVWHRPRDSDCRPLMVVAGHVVVWRQRWPSTTTGLRAGRQRRSITLRRRRRTTGRACSARPVTSSSRRTRSTGRCLATAFVDKTPMPSTTRTSPAARRIDEPGPQH